MDKFTLLEQAFDAVLKQVDSMPKEVMIDVDLALLDQMGVTEDDHFISSKKSLTRSFQVIETVEKITLFNDHFVIWIVPQMIDETSATYAFIALNTRKIPKLELVFVASGVYNSSRLILRLLERLLIDIEENEALIKKLNRRGD